MICAATDLVQVLSLALSIDVWTVGAIGGINHYRIDLVEGIEHSLLVICPEIMTFDMTAQLIFLLQCLIIAAFLSSLPLSAVKISILLFYQRIFPTQKFKLAVQITIPFIAAWGVIFSFVSILVRIEESGN